MAQRSTKARSDRVLGRTQSLTRLIAEGDKVVAERFRTKMCHHFVENGSCPYESRCMFAHGRHQLRTKDMNLRDGLVNEEAIRQFKRGLSMNAKQRNSVRAATAQPFHSASSTRSETEDSPMNCSNPRSPRSSVTSPASDEGETPPRLSSDIDLLFLSEVDEPNRQSTSTPQQCTPRCFRRDPYSLDQPIVLTTLSLVEDRSQRQAVRKRDQ